MSDNMYEVWEWMLDQKLDTLHQPQKAFELTTKYFKDKFDSNEIRQFLIKRGFFDNEE